jgi:hypothetical protein
MFGVIPCPYSDVAALAVLQPHDMYTEDHDAVQYGLLGNFQGLVTCVPCAS